MKKSLLIGAAIGLLFSASLAFAQWAPFVKAKLGKFDKVEANTVTATTITGATVGNATTATALAANGANCSAGSAPLGVSAAGAVESCTDYEEDLADSAGLRGALSDESGTGVALFQNGSILGPVPTTQVIGAGGTIAADACGSVKRISSASGVTTDTTNTFTAPAAGNTGCHMTVCNENASDTITLDTNVLFQSAGAANVVVAALDCVQVVSSGAKWYQASALLDN